jgi:hypothetical protein
MRRTLLLTALALLGAAAPAHADIHVQTWTDGSGTIQSAGQYLCPMISVGPRVTRGCGSITGAPRTVTLTAVPKPDPPGHWRLVRWEGGDCGVTPTCTFEAVDGYHSVTAVFEDPVAPSVIPVVELSATQDRTVRLGWTANEWMAATCTLQGTVLPTCPDAQDVTLPEGAYTFSVRGEDVSENVSAPVQRSFRILDTVLVSGPASVSNAKTATFTVSSTLGTRFDCTLDARYIRACATPGADGLGTVTLPDLAEGRHTLRVYAVDGQDADTVPVTRIWTVDTLAPVATLAAGADGTFAFASSEETARFECQVDGAPFVPCAAEFQPAVGPGEHRIAVRAVDRAGNLSATVTHTWSVAAPVPSPPVAQPSQHAQPAAISTLAGRRKVSRQRTVELARVTCPAGAACPITAPRTAKVKIAGKRYTVAVTRTKRRVGLKLSKAAYAKLKGRTGSVTVTVSATATGASATTLTVNATIRR